MKLKLIIIYLDEEHVNFPISTQDVPTFQCIAETHFDAFKDFSKIIQSLEQKNSWKMPQKGYNWNIELIDLQHLKTGYLLNEGLWGSSLPCTMYLGTANWSAQHHEFVDIELDSSPESNGIPETE